MRPRIAIVHPSFSGIGGAEVVAVNQAQWFHRQGLDVHIITGELAPRLWANKLDGIAVDLLPTERIGARLQRPARSFLQLVTELWRARGVATRIRTDAGLSRDDEWRNLASLAGIRRTSKFLRRRLAAEDPVRAVAAIASDLERLLAGTDVAVAHNYPMSSALALANTTARKVWYCHEPHRVMYLSSTRPRLAARVADGLTTNTMAEHEFATRLRRQQHPLARILDPELTGRASDLASVAALDVICVNSRYTGELCRATYGDRAYRVIPPLMELPDATQRRSGLRREPLRILAHSRLEPPKNIDTIIRGLAHLTREFGRRADLDIVGEGSVRPELERLVGDLQLESMIRFHGFVSEAALSRIYDQCDVFALLPIDEPFGMVFPEAMLRGLIAVGSDHGGPSEILEQGCVGFVCDPFSPADLGRVFERILNLSDVEVDALRSEADRSCRARFATDRIGAELLSACALTPAA